MNANHVVYTARVMLPQLVKRFNEKNKKSGIVVTSSVMSILPMPSLNCYSATKIFVDYIAEGLNFELKDKVDVISYQPAWVATKMIDDDKADFWTILPKDAADVCFRDIGLRPMTRGAFSHELIGYMMECYPWTLF